ncbi:hypothetical protein G3760_003592 [Salmonella enterica]|nr:hypothetical protein [Salmonella enterica]
MPLRQLRFLLYVVLFPDRLDLLHRAENSGMIISSPCYTSGKIAIAEKSDHPKTAIR